MSRFLQRSIVFAFVFLAFLALAVGIRSAHSAALDELRIDWATYNPVSIVIRSQGLLEKEFEKDGTKVRWVQTLGSNKALEFLNASSIDFGSTAGSAALVARINGNPIKSIYVYSRPEWTALVTRKDTGIAKVADLKGKSVAVTRGTDPHIFLVRALAEAGLSDKDVTITPVPFPAMQEAMRAGKIDVGEFPQPFAALLENQAKVRKIFDAKYGVPFDEELIVIAGKDEFLKKNPAAIRGFLEDVKATTRFYLDRPKEARQLLIDAKMVRVSPDVYLTMNDYYRDPTLRPDAEALAKMQEFQIKAGFQKKSADIKALVDTSYLPK